MNSETQPRILIVDDEESYRAPLAGFLREKGYHVDIAVDAEQSLALMRYAEGNFDIVFVDQVLHGKGLDGIGLVAAIRSEFPEVPIVVVTGWATSEKGMESLRLGAYRYISKSAGISEIELLIAMASEVRRQTVDQSSSEVEPVRPTKTRKIRILVVFANPRGTDPLRLATEDRVIRESLRRSLYRDNFIVDFLHAATIHDLRRALLEQEYSIV